MAGPTEAVRTFQAPEAPSGARGNAVLYIDGKQVPPQATSASAAVPPALAQLTLKVEISAELVRELLAFARSAQNAPAREVAANQAPLPPERAITEEDLSDPDKLAAKLAALAKQASAPATEFSSLTAAVEKLVTDSNEAAPAASENEKLKALLDLLRSNGEPGGISQEDLLQFVRSQGVPTQQAAERMRELLLALTQANMLETLQAVLRGVSETANPTTDRDHEFLKFVQSFQSDLGECVENGADEDEIKTLLRASHETLQSDYLDPSAAVESPLSPPFAAAARRLNQILTTVVNAPDGTLTEDDRLDLRQAVQAVHDLEPHAETEADFALLQRLRDFNAGDPAEREGGADTFREAHDLTEYLAAIGAGSDQQGTQAHAAAQPIGKVLADVIAAFEEGSAPLSAAHGSDSLALLLRDPEASRALALLQSVDTGTDLSPVEKNLVQFARSLPRIDTTTFAPEQTPLARADLREAFGQLKDIMLVTQARSALSPHPVPGDAASVTLDRLLAGQTLANSLAPVAQSLGQPAMLMFPLFMPGFFCQCAISFGASTAGAEDAENEMKGGNKKKKEARSRFYRRFQFSAVLPKLGRLEADIAFQGAEIIICIAVETQFAAEKINARRQYLEAALRRGGFTAISIRVSKQANATQPFGSRGISREV